MCTEADYVLGNGLWVLDLLEVLWSPSPYTTEQSRLSRIKEGICPSSLGGAKSNLLTQNTGHLAIVLDSYFEVQT